MYQRQVGGLRTVVLRLLPTRKKKGRKEKVKEKVKIQEEKRK